MKAFLLARVVSGGRLRSDGYFDDDGCCFFNVNCRNRLDRIADATHTRKTFCRVVLKCTFFGV